MNESDQKKPKKKKRKPTAYEQACAERLMRLAEERKLGQDVFAEALGISQGAVSHYYTGENPLNVRRLIDFSRVLGCMPNDIDPECRIFNLFPKEDLEMFSLVRHLPEDRKQKALAFLAGFLAGRE